MSRGLGQQGKLKCGPFLKSALAHITNLETFVKARQDVWNIFELMEHHEVLVDSQLLSVEVKPTNHSCHFLFVGPPAANNLLL